MDISIIIVNYNTFELTSKCIESVIKHTTSLNYEIILVDNASSECDASLFLTRFPSISLIQSKENVGFAKGNNLGITIARGKYILLLNSDTELIQNSIKASYEFMEKHHNIGVHSVKLIYPEGKHQSVAQRFPSIKYQLIELLRIQKLLNKDRCGKLLLGAFFNHLQTVEVDWVWGAYFFFRKDILMRLPNYKLDDSYFMYFEDMQWCLDIKKLNYKIYYFAATTVIHKMGGSSANKQQLMKANELIFLNKNFHPIKVFLIQFLRKCLQF